MSRRASLRQFGLAAIASAAVVGWPLMSHAHLPTSRIEAIETALDDGAGAAAVANRLAFSAERYRTMIFPAATVTTHTYGTAPGLTNGQPVTLLVDVYRPATDAAVNRPLLVWIHGGGFAAGNRSSMSGVATAYARLGYVTASISYRLDPGNKCQQVQDGLFTGDQLVAERERCQRAILAARDDAATAIAWLRDNAVAFGVDPTKVAVGGSSAGAVTAVHVGQTLNVPGSPAPAASTVSAVLAMSGCNYFADSIDSFDAPVAMLASGGDSLVPFACSVATVDAAAAAGTSVLRNFHALESLHAQALYYAYQPEVDRAWRLFLIDHLELA